MQNRNYSCSVAETNPMEQQLQQHLDKEEELSSPITNQILDLGNDVELFNEAICTSEVSSCSGRGVGGNGCGCGGEGGNRDVCCYDDASFSSPFASFASVDAATLAALLQPPIPVNYPPHLLPSTTPALSCISNNPNNQFSPVSLTGDALDRYGMACSTELPAVPLLTVTSSQRPQFTPPVPLPHLAFEDECLVTLPGMDYMGATTCSYVDPSGAGIDVHLSGSMGMSIPGDVIFTGNLLLGAEGAASMPELADYQSNCSGLGFFASENTHRQQITYDSGEMKVFNDDQHIIATSGSPTRLASEMPSLDEPAFKFGRLSMEERKEKISRYLKKRNVRNFSKKIKYACRKTLADSRPRVRGRFAKNDESWEAVRPNSSNHEDKDDEDAIFKGDDVMDSSDIFAQLSSFKCNYTLESWI